MNYDKKEVMARMKGLWPDALVKLCGVNPSVFKTKRHQPCMYCGGNDRFRWTDKVSEQGDGGAICNQCGAGDGIRWVEKLRGESFSEAVNTVGEWLNLVPVEVVNKANKAASRVQRYKNGAQSSPDRINLVMSKTEVVYESQILRFEGLHTYDGMRVGRNEIGEVIHAEPCFMVYEDGLSDEPCNVKFINEEGEESYLAKDYTRGSVVPVSKCSDGAIYLTVGWINALHVSACTKRTTYDCLTHHNLEMVAYELRHKECRIACLKDDLESLYVADDRGLKVVVPNGRNFKMGLERKLYSPQDLIDKHS